jgi:hypothetical protein
MEREAAVEPPATSVEDDKLSRETQDRPATSSHRLMNAVQ